MASRLVFIEHMRTKFVAKIDKGRSASQKGPSWRDQNKEVAETEGVKCHPPRKTVFINFKTLPLPVDCRNILADAQQG